MELCGGREYPSSWGSAHPSLQHPWHLCTTSNLLPSLPFPKAAKKQQPCFIGGNSILQGLSCRGKDDSCLQEGAWHCTARQPWLLHSHPPWMWRRETTWCLAGREHQHECSLCLQPPNHSGSLPALNSLELPRFAASQEESNRGCVGVLCPPGALPSWSKSQGERQR